MYSCSDLWEVNYNMAVLSMRSELLHGCTTYENLTNTCTAVVTCEKWTTTWLYYLWEVNYYMAVLPMRSELGYMAVLPVRSELLHGCTTYENLTNTCTAVVTCEKWTTTWLYYLWEVNNYMAVLYMRSELLHGCTTYEKWTRLHGCTTYEKWTTTWLYYLWEVNYNMAVLPMRRELLHVWL